MDAFRGGTDAQDVTVVTQSDLTDATATLKTALDQQTHDQAQRALPAGRQLAPLQCTTRTTANHQAGDQASEVEITVSAHCLPLVYALASVQQQSMTVLSSLLPHIAEDSIFEEQERKCWVCYGVLAWSAGILGAG